MYIWRIRWHVRVIIQISVKVIIVVVYILYEYKYIIYTNLGRLVCENGENNGAH